MGQELSKTMQVPPQHTTWLQGVMSRTQPRVKGLRTLGRCKLAARIAGMVMRIPIPPEFSAATCVTASMIRAARLLQPRFHPCLHRR
jgi:hypothetical protein